MPANGRAQQGNTQPGDLAAIVWWRRAPGHSVDLTGLRMARHLSPVLSCGWGAEWDFFTVVQVSSLQALHHLGAALTQHGQEMTAVLGRQDQGPAQGKNVP